MSLATRFVFFPLIMKIVVFAAAGSVTQYWGCSQNITNDKFSNFRTVMSYAVTILTRALLGFHAYLRPFLFTLPGGFPVDLFMCLIV